MGFKFWQARSEDWLARALPHGTDAPKLQLFLLAGRRLLNSNPPRRHSSPWNTVRTC